MCCPEAERRPEAVHVLVGGVHHGERVSIRPENPLPLPDAGGPGVRQVRLPRHRQDDRRHHGGEAAHPGAHHCPDHARLQVRRPLAAIRLPLAPARHPLAASQHRRRGEDRRIRHALQGVHRSAGQELRHGGRCLGSELHRRRESIAAR